MKSSKYNARARIIALSQKYASWLAVVMLGGLVGAAGCGGPERRSIPESRALRDGPPSGIRIATFNIQIFGKTKASKPAILSQLADIVRKYDIVAVQEIRDASESAPKTLLDAVNDGGTVDYDLVLGPRTGNQADDQSNREQYAFYFNKDTIEPRGTGRLFDDAADDFFQREPFMAAFAAKNGSFSFVLIAIHTDPDEAVAEIGSLHDVVLAARDHFSGEDDFIVLGDFNAGCDYASPDDLDALTIRGDEYRWLVPDDADTNVSPTRACAYDRIVVTANTDAEFTGRWGVDEAFTDNAVSDHWPVWAEFAGEEE